MGEEILRMEAEIIELDEISCQMEEDLARLVKDFEHVARTTYLRYRTDHFWLSLLTAGGISRLYYRAIYFREFARFRKRQIEAIQHTRDYLTQKAATYQQRILEMNSLIAEKADEMGKLKSSQASQQKILKHLKSQETTYQQEIQLKRQRLKKLIQASEQTYLSGGLANLPAGDYAAAFPNRKGLLSWPVPKNKSILTGSFGAGEDAFGNRIVNDGIYLQTIPNQAVRAVFDGKVTAVTQLPMSGAIVIIEHGDYRTVYANLSGTTVKVGDVVARRQTIGKVRKDPRSGDSVLNFLIYRVPETFLDPQKWLVQ